MTAARTAAALALLAAATTAAGYVRSTTDGGIPLAWPVPVVSYHESSAQTFLAPSCAPGPTSGAALAAVRASFDAWRASCSDLDLVDAGPLDEIRTGIAGTSENVVVFRRGWCSMNADAASAPCMTDPDVDCGGLYDCFEDHGEEDKRTLALTSVLYYPDTGRIVDADVEMNAWDGQAAGTAITQGTSPPARGWYFTCAEPRLGEPDALPRCATYDEADCYYADLQNTLTHEVGHFIGLRHVCYAGGGGSDADLPPCDASYAQTTMYPLTAPGDVGKRTLSADDVAGLCAIYPASSGGGGGGGCGCGAGGAPGTIALLLAAAALRRRRSRRVAGPPAGQATSRPA